MTSIVDNLPKAGIEKAIPHWLIFDWPTEIQHNICKDWANFYLNRDRSNIAMHYYSEALQLDYHDYTTLYQRSKAHRKLANIEEALSDATLAAEMAELKLGPNCHINLQICDALFELNRFELSNLELHNNARLFKGVKSKIFLKRQVVVEDIIKDVTGKSLSLFYLKYPKIVKEVNDLIKAGEVIDERPRWKILRDQGKCDTLSIPEVEHAVLYPLEKERRRLAFSVLHQTYMNDSWYDILFMRALRKNPNLLLNQCKRSKNFLAMLSVRQYDIVRQFMKMLQSRSPLYHVSYLKYPNKKLLEKNKEANLFRVQYQTHRNMIHDLKYIRTLRKEKRVKELSNYIEKIMGDYYVIKTNRVMCWKFEFVTEVYNTLALALVEQYHVPKNLKYYSSTAMLRLLLLPMDKLKDLMTFVFGDRSTYHDSDVQDPNALRARKMIARLESRMLYSKHSIEKCYILHQIASVHLSQGHYDECCFTARKTIKQSQVCNSLIWRFLSILQIIKANTVQRKIEGTREALEMAVPIVQKMNSPTLTKFIDVCTICTEDEFSRKMSIIQSIRLSKGSALSPQPSTN